MNDSRKYGEYSAECPDVESAKTALIWLSIGMGVGAILSLLLAPRSGPEIRQAVRGKFDDARRGLNQQTSRIRQQAIRLGGKVREKVMPISRTQ